VVGIVSLLWNAGGAYDYLMSQTGNADYLSALSQAQRLFLTQAPVWFHAAWAFGVWGSVLGSVLILGRSRFAVSALALSLAGLIASSIYSFVLATPTSYAITGNFAVWFTALIGAVIVLLLVYSRAMAARGHLR
jgi:hypothetical protein